MAVVDILKEVVVNEELASQELETSSGGGYVNKCGVYRMTIQKAFFTETKKGGVQLDLHFGGDNTFETTMFPVIVKDGKKVTTYTVKGKVQSLGDYKILKQLLFVTNGKPMDLKDLTLKPETITYKAYGKDVTVDAETCEDLVGKDVYVGVRLSEKYAYDKDAGEVDKTQLMTNGDGDIIYDRAIYSVYSQTGKTTTEMIKNLEATQMKKDAEFLESDKGIKRVKLEASDFDDVSSDLDDDLDF
jgi:hypothetical protein